MSNNFSYIVPYFHSYHNIKLLKRIVREVINIPGSEVIIIECGEKSELKSVDFPARIEFVNSNTYNLGWLYNIGQYLATKDKFFFGDFRYFPSFNLIKAVLENNTHECLYIQSKVIKLNREETLAQKLNPGKSNSSQNISEGVIYCTRSGYDKVGGFDENLFGVDMYKLHEHKAKTFLTAGQVSEGITYEYITDLPVDSENIKQSSENHLKRIIQLDDQKLLNYMRVQHKKKSISKQVYYLRFDG